MELALSPDHEDDFIIKSHFFVVSIGRKSTLLYQKTDKSNNFIAKRAVTWSRFYREWGKMGKIPLVQVWTEVMSTIWRFHTSL